MSYLSLILPEAQPKPRIMILMEQKILKRIQELTESVERNSKERARLVEHLQLLDHDIKNDCIAIQTLRELLIDDPSEPDKSA